MSTIKSLLATANVRKECGLLLNPLQEFSCQFFRDGLKRGSV